jgi:hypothetical protein
MLLQGTTRGCTVATDSIGRIIMSTLRWVMWALVLTSLVSTGCEATAERSINEASLRLRKLSQMFLRYASSHKGEMPRDEKALKDFIKTIPEQERTGMEIKSIDDLFISPNDSKPFIIKYGLKSGGGGVMAGGVNMPNYGKTGPGGPTGGPTGSNARPDMPIMAAEASGAKRYVLFVSGEVRQMDEADVQRLLK